MAHFKNSGRNKLANIERRKSLKEIKDSKKLKGEESDE